VTIFGITGTQHGANEVQLAALGSFIRHPTTTGIHHGDCIGVDAQAHWIAYQASKNIDVHPPSDPRKRAWCDHTIGGFHDGEYTGKLTIHRMFAYRTRNYHIVDRCEHLLVIPHLMVEEIYSGTWMTTRYARKKRRSHTIIWPDGNLQKVA
jgi:hypothetical protein